MKYSEYVYERTIQIRGIKGVIRRVIFKLLKFYFFCLDDFFENNIANIENNIQNFQKAMINDYCSPMTIDAFRLFIDILNKKNICAEEKNLEQKSFEYEYFPELNYETKIVCCGDIVNCNSFVSGLHAYGNEVDKNWAKDEINVSFVCKEIIKIARLSFDIADVFNVSQRVKVFLNNQEILNSKISNSGIFSFVFPKSDTNKYQFKIIFEDAISPKKLGVSDDTRLLSIALNSITLEKED